MVNDDIANRILSGTLIVKSNVARFTETGVVFENGDRVDVDVVIFATGYNFSFPFIDEKLVKVCFRCLWPRTVGKI